MNFDDVMCLLADRRRDLATPFSRMQTVCDLYNSDLAVPLPEINKNELPSIANLATQGIDQYGMRIASVMPDITYPSARPGIKKHDDDSRDRRQVSYGWWQENNYRIQMRRRARWYVAYTSAPVLIRWDSKLGCPRWQPISPLGTYPAQTSNIDDVAPPDCIFTFRRSYGWLENEYPDHARKLKLQNKAKHVALDLVLYVDANEFILGVSVPGATVESTWDDDGRKSHVQLGPSVPNRAGICPAVVPGRITLDRPMGMIDSMVGQYVQEAEFMALATIAARKAIFPDLWLVAPSGGNAQIVKPANGLRGEVGKITGGTLDVVQPQPGYLTMPVMDRLRENQRLTAGIPADLTGEAGTNVRTGRRANQLVSAVVDFPVQEAQDVFAAAQRQELVVAAALDKAYSTGTKTFHVSWKGARGQVEYTAKELWKDAPPPVVDYAYAGTDSNGLVIEGGQRLGMGTMSKKTFMSIDPLISDAELEHDLVVGEGLEAALIAGIQAQAQAGQIPPTDVARIMALVITNRKDLAEAVAQVQREAQERQAQQVEPTSPEAQAGIALPGAGAEAGAIPPPPDSMGNLNSLLMQLRGPGMETQAETASVTG